MDHPVLPGELGAVVRDWHGTGPQDLVATGLLVFLVRTSMSPVAVRLDGADDPEVLVRVVDATPDRGWRRCADRFSTFIYTHVWEWGGGFWGDECSLQAQDRALDQTDLALLRCRLIEGPRTHGWPGRTTYRFSDGNAPFLIWDDEERQADWMLWPRPRRSSPDSLSRFGSAARWRANYVPSASAARRC